MQLLEEIQALVAAVADRVGPSVVGLRGRRRAVGSGVVIAPGCVLSVAHALGRDPAVDVMLAGGSRQEGRVTAEDPDLGIAIVRAETAGAPALDLGEDPGPAPGIGAPVLALADPAGSGLRVTFGLVTSAPAAFRGPRGRPIAGAIEHDAPLPRGSSGGPLVDAQGRLVGLNAVRRDTGLILALPADEQLRERAGRLARGEAVAPRRLGVAVAPPALARRMRGAVGLPERDGLLVHAVEDGSPARRAGLQRGDLLVSAGGRELGAGAEELHAALDAMPDGHTLVLHVVRGTQEREVAVALDGAGVS